MAESNGIDWGLRAAFLLPALVIIVILAIAATIVPDLVSHIPWIMPAVTFTALISLMLTERKRRQRKPD